MEQKASGNCLNTKGLNERVWLRLPLNADWGPGETNCLKKGLIFHNFPVDDDDD